VGPISFVAGDNGLKKVAFLTLQALKQKESFLSSGPSMDGLQTLNTLLVEMNAYLCGRPTTFTVNIDWDVLDGFQRQVLAMTADIPYGQVLTYGDIAQRLGNPGAARAVGNALGRNSMPILIPCHRVIGSDFALHGYIAGQDVKAFLLRLEGHKIINQRVV
jgi:methylated-DNA-[protein]-cysteine S-methyltransferase